MSYTEAASITEMFLRTTDAFGITSNIDENKNFVCGLRVTDVFLKMGVIEHDEE